MLHRFPSTCFGLSDAVLQLLIVLVHVVCTQIGLNKFLFGCTCCTFPRNICSCNIFIVRKVPILPIRVITAIRFTI